MFRYTDVACSKECGQEYLRQVLEARGQLPKEEPAILEGPRATRGIDVEEAGSSIEEVETEDKSQNEEDSANEVRSDAEAEEANERKEAEEVPVPRKKRRRHKG